MESHLAALLIDWRGTIACDPEERVWFHAAAATLGRELDDETAATLSRAVASAAVDPRFAERLARSDCSSTDHRCVNLELFAAAGMDDAFAETLYNLDFDPAFHPFFPDAAPVLSTLHERGINIIVVSDVHFDLRPEFAAAGLDDYIDGYVLSFEHGIQKPDQAIFDLALAPARVRPEQALMVGDNPRRDGGAAMAGIPTLLLPPLRTCTTRGLKVLLRIITHSP